MTIERNVTTKIASEPQGFVGFGGPGAPPNEMGQSPTFDGLSQPSEATTGLDESGWRKADGGTYVLLVDKYDRPTRKNDEPLGEIVDYVLYKKGDDVECRADEAKRLGLVGALAQPGTVAAKMAKGEIRPEAINLAASESQLEQQLEAIQARLDELKDHSEERQALLDSGKDLNVSSMRMGSDDNTVGSKSKKGYDKSNGESEAKGKRAPGKS